MRNFYAAIIFIFFTLEAVAGSIDNPSSKTPADSLAANVSGSKTDSVDIKQMVLAQIENARIKQARDSSAALDTNKILNVPASSAIVAAPVVVTVKPKAKNSALDDFYNATVAALQSIKMSNEMTIKLGAMGVVSCLVFMFVIVRRKKISTETIAKRNVKDGIKLIREEKVKDKKDSKLSLVRNKLINTTMGFQLSKDSVTKNARELNIAKGEIYLAARIKSHELKKASY